MIKTSIHRAAESKRPICLNPKPKTRRDALRNLTAFAAEPPVQYSPAPPATLDWTPVDWKTLEIHTCFGWTEMPYSHVMQALACSSKSAGQFPQVDRAYADLDKDGRCFAIVYSFVPKEELEVEIVQQQLDFFHLAGFVLVPFREQNWRGKGVLVDLCDLVPPHSERWRQDDYRRMGVGWYFAEMREW